MGMLCLKSLRKQPLPGFKLPKVNKSAEAGLMSAKRQVRELQKKYDDEFNRVYELRAENKNLLADLEAAQAKFKKAKDAGEAYYDQGFDEETASLKSQLGKKYNLWFLQGWYSALDQAKVDDASDLYNKGRMLQPYKVALTEEIKETPVDDPQNLEQVQVEDVNEGEDEDDDEEDDEVEDVTNRLTDANA